MNQPSTTLTLKKNAFSMRLYTLLHITDTLVDPGDPLYLITLHRLHHCSFLKAAAAVVGHTEEANFRVQEA